MVEVNACHWCDVPAREHANRWHPVAGWHTWQAPTPEQRRERVAERLERLNQHASPYEQGGMFCIFCWSDDCGGGCYG